MFKRLLPWLTLLLVAAVMAGIYWVYRANPNLVEGLKSYGYLGVFLISALFNASVILPAGNFLAIIAFGAALPAPVLVGLAGGAGAAIGETTSYLAGYSGRAVIARQDLYLRMEGWVKRWGMLAIFVLAVVPFFFDLAGIAAGILRLPLWKYLLACFAGRSILYTLFALAGAYGWEALLRFIG